VRSAMMREVLVCARNCADSEPQITAAIKQCRDPCPIRPLGANLSPLLAGQPLGFPMRKSQGFHCQIAEAASALIRAASS